MSRLAVGKMGELHQIERIGDTFDLFGLCRSADRKPIANVKYPLPRGSSAT
jgi:hypothetical protein